MENKIKNRIIEGLPYAALFVSSFTCYNFIPEFNILTGVHGETRNAGLDFVPGGIMAVLPELINRVNPFAVPIIGAGIITLTAFLISASINHLNGKGERSIPFFVSVMLIWITADGTLPVSYLAGMPVQVLLFTLIHDKNRLVYALIFPAWYFATGGFSIIFAGMLMFNLVIERRKEWKLLLLLPVLIIVTMLVSGHFFQVPLLYPVELPADSFRRMLFLTVFAVLVLIPVFSRFDFHMTTYISVRYTTASILLSCIIIFAVLMIALHETGFLPSE